MNNKWNELTIRTEYDKWPDLEGFLYENDLYSFELIDPRLENIENIPGRWDFIEEDLFKDQFQGITVKIYTTDDDNLVNLEEIKNSIRERKLGETNLMLIDNQDWKNNWKDFYETQEIGEKIVIKPTWESYDNKDNRHIIELDPGMAFGTGGHETTRMCLLHLQKYLKVGNNVIDVGCGSGILSIASKMLGADKVIGCDLDKSVVDISKENAKLNRANVEFVESDLFSNINIKANLVIANIVAEIIVLLIKDLNDYLFSDGIFICSGIIKDKSYLVEESLIENAYEILEKTEENNWISIVARNKNA